MASIKTAEKVIRPSVPQTRLPEDLTTTKKTIATNNTVAISFQIRSLNEVNL